MEEQGLALQKDLAMVDMLSAPSRGGGDMQFLLLRLQRLALRMEPDQHARAHIHIDYGPLRHTASFAVDTGERLAGKLPLKYDKKVASWIDRNRPVLQSAWDDVKAGKAPRATLVDLTE